MASKGFCSLYKFKGFRRNTEKYDNDDAYIEVKAEKSTEEDDDDYNNNNNNSYNNNDKDGYYVRLTYTYSL